MKQPRALIIIGASGDLARRMLFPSLYLLEQGGLLPEDLLVVGCSRAGLSDADFTTGIEHAVRERVDAVSNEIWRRLAQRLRHAALDATVPESFAALRHALSGTGEKTFYLSTSPRHYGDLCRNLSEQGLAGPESRVVVEKPIGHDLASCRAINDALAAIFSEDRIFRIDHYLGKEAVQNLLALRFANALFEPLWNKVSIARIDITVAETVGVEDRWSYYDEYGAIRDMVQNHLMQLLCLVAMEPPADLDPDAVRNEKVKVLRSLRRISDLERDALRGQYEGYANEPGGRASETETFVSLTAHIDNWRWAGVPFHLTTGKKLCARRSEIVIQFREVPHSIFGGDLLANRLTIRLQPEEEIALTLMNRTPSLERIELQPLSLNLSLSETFRHSRRRIAYERLLLEALHGRSTLFVRRDEAEAAWVWIDSIIDGWKARGTKLLPYTPGSWGPNASPISSTALPDRR
ncbi:MAG TPA: glucose-6-phosphate dehydrogenase [Rhizomicrobium sp.]|jgi:glucose-6-phosphate 1-dehydrogenase